MIDLNTRAFFRVIRSHPPDVADFQSNAARGDQPPDDAFETMRIWSGVSVYATAAQARRMARRYSRHGRFIALLAIRAGGPIRLERTLGRPGHHTLWGDPVDLLAAVGSVEPIC